MTTSETMPAAQTTPALLTPESLLTYWRGHRGLTRRTIEAFPEEHLFSFAVGGMRPFGELAWELVGMVDYNARGLQTGDWSWAPPEGKPPHSREALLAAWDGQTPELEAALLTCPLAEYVRKQDMAWGRFSPLESVMYAIDNENHHRGQGYVYLRALGIEPPAFYDRFED